MTGAHGERRHSLVPDFDTWFGREFGGALTADNPDLVARAMVRRGKGGDFRDPARIREWAHRIGAELGTTD
ncbi:hypothetical protein [Streptomyces sp. NPDC085529]|uniref:hypothetical protein n=1 Tax=Streptomyces sp. NPDC085529 TaxID=3365729 RepID=UPI0037D4F9BA